MKEIRLQVACRYLQRHGGELEGERGYVNMAGYIGTPPTKDYPVHEGGKRLFTGRAAQSDRRSDHRLADQVGLSVCTDRRVQIRNCLLTKEIQCELA